MSSPKIKEEVLDIQLFVKNAIVKENEELGASNEL